MSAEQFHEIEHIAELLVEATQRVLKLQGSGNLPGPDTLHAAISHPHRLCHHIYDGAQQNTGTNLPNLCRSRLAPHLLRPY
jgi:hypothetical protein